MRLVLPIEKQAVRRIGESVTSHRKGSHRPHKGLDLFAPAGTVVGAPIDGRVLRVVNGREGRTSQQRAGWFVDIAGVDGHIYRLLHLGAEIVVKRGDRVTAGQRIGVVGARGTSGILRAQPHLHFEIAQSDFDAARKDYGARIDPLTVLPLGPYMTERRDMADINWRGILDKAIDIGAPILGTAINSVAPGAGTAVATALPLVKTYVVDEYVPGTNEPAPAPAPVPAAMIAAPAPAPRPSPEIQTATAVLLKKGWSQEDVQQHLQPPAVLTPQRSVPASMPPLDHEHGAHLVHGVLQEAGWHPEARSAILRGPYAFAEYQRPRQHVPDEPMLARLAEYNHDAILQASLHHTTERGGHAPELYHGTHDAQLAGLGTTTEHPERKGT